MTEQDYPDRGAASRAAARIVAAALERRLRRRKEAAAVIAGGSTPRECYRLLSRAKLDFSRIHFVPSDERWLPADDSESNERMIRESLLNRLDPPAGFMPFYDASISSAETCGVLAGRFKKLPLPPAITLLGIGADGHFASLFPDLPGLADALDPEGEDLFVCGTTAASPYPRISLTLKALTMSDGILVVAFGDDKKKVIAAARAGDGRYPLHALFRQTRAPVRVLWAP